jgi:hypothetical protein
VSNIVGNVLIDENDTDIVTYRKVLESFFYLLQLRVLLDDQKVGPICRAVTYTS